MLVHYPLRMPWEHLLITQVLYISPFHSASRFYLECTIVHCTFVTYHIVLLPILKKKMKLPNSSSYVSSLLHPSSAETSSPLYSKRKLPFSNNLFVKTPLPRWCNEKKCWLSSNHVKITYVNWPQCMMAGMFT